MEGLSFRTAVSRRGKAAQSTDRLQDGLRPADGLLRSLMECVWMDAVVRAEGIAAEPVCEFVSLNPGKGRALGAGFSAERIGDGRPQGELCRDVLERRTEHGGEQAEHAEEILLGGVETAGDGGELAEAGTHEGHVQKLAV